MITTVRRYDRGTLREPKVLASGARRIDGHASRVGVFPYRNHDGSTRLELRLPEEVFAKQSLDSYEGAWITDGHPTDFVTPETARELSRGLVTEPARADGDMVAMSSVVDDKRLLKKLDELKAAGKSAELSVGYNVDLDMTPGHHPVYGRYDAIQRNIRVNHIAAIDTRIGNGRAGAGAKLRLDEAEGELRLDDNTTIPAAAAARPGIDNATTGRSSTMTPEEIEALKKQYATEKKRADTEAKRADDERKRADAAEGMVNGLKAENQKLAAVRTDENELAGLRGAVTDLQAKLAEEQRLRKDETDPKEIQKRVQKRLSIVKGALEVDPNFRFDDLSDRDIQVQTIAKINGESIPSVRSDDYVDGVFGMLIEGRRTWTKAMPRIDGTTIIVKTEGARAPAADDAKPKKSLADLGKEPLPNSRERRLS